MIRFNKSFLPEFILGAIALLTIILKNFDIKNYVSVVMLIGIGFPFFRKGKSTQLEHGIQLLVLILSFVLSEIFF